MNRKRVNILLVILSLAIIFVISRDFIIEKAGKNTVNPFKYEVEEFKNIDSMKVLYHETTTFQVGSETPSGLTVFEKLILVVTENQLIKYDYSGKELLKTELPDTASCITTSPDGTIYIGMLHQVCSFDQNGKLVQKWNTFGPRAVLTSLVSDGKSMFVGDAGNRIVYKCNMNGEVLMKIGEKNDQKGVPGYIIPSAHLDVALDDNGFLWAANTGRHNLENYNPDGSLRTSWGKASFKIDGFSGCCNPANFAILSDNSFITSEKGIPRIKLYDQHGVLKGVVAAPEKFENGSIAPDLAIDSEQRIVTLDFNRNQVRIFEKN
jgi:hypothetical protein